MPVELGSASRPSYDAAGTALQAALKKKQLENELKIAKAQNDTQLQVAGVHAGASTAAAQIQQEIHDRALAAQERQARAHNQLQADMHAQSLQAAHDQAMMRANLERQALALQAQRQRAEQQNLRNTPNQLKILQQLQNTHDEILMNDKLDPATKARALRNVKKQMDLVSGQKHPASADELMGEAAQKLQLNLLVKKSLAESQQLGESWRVATQELKEATGGLVDKTNEPEPDFWRTKGPPSQAEIEKEIEAAIKAETSDIGGIKTPPNAARIAEIARGILSRNKQPIPNPTPHPAPKTPEELSRLPNGAKFWDSKAGILRTKELPQQAPAPQPGVNAPTFSMPARGPGMAGAFSAPQAPAAPAASTPRTVQVPKEFSSDLYQRDFLHESTPMSRSLFGQFTNVFDKAKGATPAVTDKSYQDYLKAREAVRSQIPTAPKVGTVPQGVPNGAPFFDPAGRLQQNNNGMPAPVPKSYPVQNLIRPQLPGQPQSSNGLRRPMENPLFVKGPTAGPTSAAAIGDFASGRTGTLQDLGPQLAGKKSEADKATAKKEYEDYQRQLAAWQLDPSPWTDTSIAGVRTAGKGAPPTPPFGSVSQGGTPQSAPAPQLAFVASGLSGMGGFSQSAQPNYAPMPSIDYASAYGSYGPSRTQFLGGQPQQDAYQISAPYEEPWSQTPEAAPAEYYPPFYGDPAYSNPGGGFYPGGDYNINTDYVGTVA